MCGKVGQDRSSSPVSVTSSTFEEVGEESIGSASCLDLSSRARPGGADIRGGAAVSRVLSPDGEAPTASISAAGQHAVVKAALSMAGPRSVGASAQEARGPYCLCCRCLRASTQLRGLPSQLRGC